MNNLIKKRYTPPSSLSTAKFLKGKERFDFENLFPPPNWIILFRIQVATYQSQRLQFVFLVNGEIKWAVRVAAMLNIPLRGEGANDKGLRYSPW